MFCMGYQLNGWVVRTKSAEVIILSTTYFYKGDTT